MSQCPQCSAPLPGDFPFCPYCGTPVNRPAGEPLHEERKVVSVLFCDLVGFTAAAERSDPEDVRAGLRRYHQLLRQVIESHGGTVEKFIGDAVMAVFGAPLAHEDDAERAVRSGLRILEAIDDLNRSTNDVRLQVRIGINTGEAVVALDARTALGEGFIAGDVVNTASRIQGAASPGTVVIAAATYRQVERVIGCEPLEPVQLRGKSDQLRLWRAVAPRARFGADVVRSHATPLVGRELERPLLIALFERAAKQKTCQLVTLVGEPGVGKTRLCTELLQYVEQRPGLVRWRQGRCLPYGEGVAFWALGEIVKAECGILESDSAEEAARKLDESIPSDHLDRMWLRSRLAPLVGAGGEPVAQEESFAAWRRYIEALTASDPTVLVFEDLHWADDALLAFIEHLADWTEGLPLFVVCTARPELQERRPTWAAGLRNAQTVTLAPLTDEETARLLGLLLQRAVLPARVQQELLDRAGGNPLYAEEFVRLLGDRQLLFGPLDEVPVPDSLQALIAARLDTLSRDRKSLLQDAAVVGKVFWVGALASMGERDPRDVEHTLHELARKELVRAARTSSIQGEVEYSFWHLLVRDVCYAQIPRPFRVARHRAAAAWVERSAGERIDDVADVLAHHYVEALELARASGTAEDMSPLEDSARTYLLMAGERAIALDVASAEASFAKVLELTPAGHPQRAIALERWAHAAQQQGRLASARDALEEAVAIHRGAGTTRSVGRALTTLSEVLRIAGDQRSFDVLTEALSVLETETAGPELVTAYAERAAVLFGNAVLNEAVAMADRTLALAGRLGLPAPVRAVGVRGACRASLGDATGLDDMRSAIALAVEEGKGRDAGVLYNNLALASWQYQGPVAATAVCHEGIEFCERRGITLLTQWIEVLRLTFLAAAGRPQEALAAVDAVFHPLSEAGDSIALEARSLQLELLAKREEVAPAAIDDLIAASREVGEAQMLAIGFTTACAVLPSLGRQEEAAELIRELLATSVVGADPYYAARLPELVRSAIRIGAIRLASELVEAVDPRTPMQRHSVDASDAALREASGEFAEAAKRYGAVADAWQAFGMVPEAAYARLGSGRSARAAGLPGAEPSLQAAYQLFQSLGYTRDSEAAARILDASEGSERSA